MSCFGPLAERSLLDLPARGISPIFPPPILKQISPAQRRPSVLIVLSTVTMTALIIPIYVDTSFMMIGALGRKLAKAKAGDCQTDVSSGPSPFFIQPKF